jgi:hypothetical protein
MAGLVALMNQHQVSKGFQSQPGLGNINPQLYRLAVAASGTAVWWMLMESRKTQFRMEGL